MTQGSNIAGALALGAAMLAAPPPLAAQAAPALCPALKKIVAATAETPTWKSVRRGNTGTAVPAGLGPCTIASYSSESQYFCGKDMTAATIKPAHAKLVADVTACLGVQPARTGDAISTTHQFAVPGASVSITAVEQANANHYALGLTVIQRF